MPNNAKLWIGAKFTKHTWRTGNMLSFLVLEFFELLKLASVKYKSAGQANGQLFFLGIAELLI
jgi:hypothetical protein